MCYNFFLKLRSELTIENNVLTAFLLANVNLTIQQNPLPGFRDLSH
jgi:hypothetical protein